MGFVSVNVYEIDAVVRCKVRIRANSQVAAEGFLHYDQPTTEVLSKSDGSMSLEVVAIRELPASAEAHFEAPAEEYDDTSPRDVEGLRLPAPIFSPFSKGGLMVPLLTSFESGREAIVYVPADLNEAESPINNFTGSIYLHRVPPENPEAVKVSVKGQGIYPGTWTVSGDVLCYGCHDKRSGTERSSEERDVLNTPYITLTESDLPTTVCNVCGKRIAIEKRGDVAINHNLSLALLQVKEVEVPAQFEAFAGGNSGVRVVLNDQLSIVFAVHPHDDNIFVGYLETESAGEVEGTSFEVAGFEACVHKVVDWYRAWLSGNPKEYKPGQYVQITDPARYGHLTVGKVYDFRPGAVDEVYVELPTGNKQQFCGGQVRWVGC